MPPASTEEAEAQAPAARRRAPAEAAPSPGAEAPRGAAPGGPGRGHPPSDASGDAPGSHEHGAHAGSCSPPEMLDPAELLARADADPGAFWDARYASGDWPTEPEPVLVELVSPLLPGRALDLGCGTGRNALWLARHGWQVTGVDLSRVGLEQARAAAVARGLDLELHLADLASYPLEADAFDLVLLANIHLPHPALRELHDRAARSLRHGGHLLVIGHHLDNLGRTGPLDPERLFTEERLRALIPRSLELERLERCWRSTGSDVASGDLCVFAWARKPTIDRRD
jgi:SAM-dependent methyltransferase